jgi:hypothetical protein
MDGDSAKLESDGRLLLEVAPGPYRLSASAVPPWFAKRVLYRGREVETGAQVELTAEPGGRVEVVFSSRSATVTGGVADATGNTLADYTVVVLRKGADRSRGGSAPNLRTARGDQQGRFRVERLPPGDYVAVALADFDFESVYEPDVAEGLLRAGKPIHVGEGETVTLSLTLATPP